MIVSYEVQTRVEKTWSINAVFDDEELATDEAFRVLSEGGNFTAVRVIEESYDEETTIAKERLVLRLAVPQEKLSKRHRRAQKKVVPPPPEITYGIISEKQLQIQQKAASKLRASRWRRKWGIRSGWILIAGGAISLPVLIYFGVI